MRRKVASLYSMTSLVSYEPYVDNCVDLLNDQFTRFAESGSDTDLAHWLQCYAFDVIGEITVSYIYYQRSQRFNSTLGIQSLIIHPLWGIVW